MWSFDSLLKSQYMEEVSKTSHRLGANMDIMTSNNISGKSSTEKNDVYVLQMDLQERNIPQESAPEQQSFQKKILNYSLTDLFTVFLCVKLHCKSKGDLILHGDFGSIPTSLMRAEVELLMTTVSPSGHHNILQHDWWLSSGSININTNHIKSFSHLRSAL